jgi:hypothetical protein
VRGGRSDDEEDIIWERCGEMGMKGERREER